MSQPNLDRLRSIKTLPSLVAYLRDELDWPLASEDIEDISFDYTSAELGLAAAAVRIKEIKQLRPLHGNQPWGIFWVNFEKKQLPVVVMRLILRALVLKKRASSGQAERQAWAANDLRIHLHRPRPAVRRNPVAHLRRTNKRLARCQRGCGELLPWAVGHRSILLTLQIRTLVCVLFAHDCKHYRNSNFVIRHIHHSKFSMRNF
jgi:hypothetical protein